VRRLRNYCFILIWFFAQNVVAGEIDVMTQNQYLGADLSDILTAEPGDFNDALVAALRQIASNNTKERIHKLAAKIAKRNSHLVGLQEVFKFECTDINPLDGDACKDPSIAGAFVDHLSETLAALNGEYIEAATVVNFKLLPPPGSPYPGIPFDIDGNYAFLTVMDRDVILSRSDVAAEPVNFEVCINPSVDGCNYTIVLGPIPTPFGQVFIERGYVGVDVTIGGKAYRFVTTHLETQGPVPFIQAAQAAELIPILAITLPAGRSLIVVGDINSEPDDPDGSPYKQFLDAGYTDAWTLRPGNVPGYTCCQRKDLSNKKSILDRRIDMILSMELPEKVKQARVLGDEVSSKTHPPGRGLWPSDHGTVATGLQFY
jgi:hypothetical protein